MVYAFCTVDYMESAIYVSYLLNTFSSGSRKCIGGGGDELQQHVADSKTGFRP